MSKMQNELKNDPLMPIRHSAEHIMQLVIEKLLGAKKVMGPAIDTGFYGDFDGKISEEDLPKIEADLKIGRYYATGNRKVTWCKKSYGSCNRHRFLW